MKRSERVQQSSDRVAEVMALSDAEVVRRANDPTESPAMRTLLISRYRQLVERDGLVTP